jgi:hypothetical protein
VTGAGDAARDATCSTRSDSSSTRASIVTRFARNAAVALKSRSACVMVMPTFGWLTRRCGEGQRATTAAHRQPSSRDGAYMQRGFPKCRLSSTSLSAFQGDPSRCSVTIQDPSAPSCHYSPPRVCVSVPSGQLPTYGQPLAKVHRETPPERRLLAHLLEVVREIPIYRHDRLAYGPCLGPDVRCWCSAGGPA